MCAIRYQKPQILAHFYDLNGLINVLILLSIWDISIVVNFTSYPVIIIV